MTFDPAFRLFTADPQTRAASVPDEAIFRELDDELQRRRQSYPKLLARGQMDRVTVDHELRVWARVRDQALPVEQRRTGATGAAASWVEMIHALRREIALRRQRYPRLVAAGKIDAATAARRLELVEWMHFLHWGLWGVSAAADAELAEPRCITYLTDAFTPAELRPAA